MRKNLFFGKFIQPHGSEKATPGMRISFGILKCLKIWIDCRDRVFLQFTVMQPLLEARCRCGIGIRLQGKFKPYCVER